MNAPFRKSLSPWHPFGCEMDDWYPGGPRFLSCEHQKILNKKTSHPYSLLLEHIATHSLTNANGLLFKSEFQQIILEPI